MPDRSLQDSAQFLKGVGPKNAPAFQRLGLQTVGDVLFHLPRRYEDRRNLPKIRDLKPGEFATVKGRIIDVDARPLKRGMVILRAVLNDRSGSVALTWFNQPWIARKLESYNGEVIAYGMVKAGSRGNEIAGPEWETLEPDDDPEDFARIVPVYPLTEGLSQKSVRKATRDAVDRFLDLVQEPLPAAVRREHNLRDLVWSLQQIHAPTTDDDRADARYRLVFEEFLYMQLALALKRAEFKAETGIAFPIAALKQGQAEARPQPLEEPKAGLRSKAVVTPAAHVTLFGDGVALQSEPLWDQIARMLPFELTGAQRRVIEEIYRDMERSHPMNRLVQGDVGSGKTAVAACAILAAIRSGYQAALMAPTEILAEQHYINLHRLFDPLGLETVLMVGKLSATEKRRARQRAAEGSAPLAVGTHALLEGEVKFHNLGLVVVDEQHRFGVMQRAALREKGRSLPDVLVMTATPIPRTLQMTVHGDLDTSIIDELPPGRRPIKTHWRLPADRHKVYDALRKLIDEGRQAYVVCPLVGESELMLAQAAEELHKRLQSEVFPDLKIGLLHGKLKPKEKEDVMEAFRRAELHILVSTTVIEVGVDVPNATTMVIEDANRFGLAQLHQLRGRVGRGGHQSFCVLIADSRSEDTTLRLETLVSTTDGFKIAQADLEIRGPGEMLGTRQSGNLDLKIADLVRDAKVLEVARQAAIELVDANPGLTGPEWILVRERLTERRAAEALIAVS
jgi:ATP-dependent DNA helicase RecG